MKHLITICERTDGKSTGQKTLLRRAFECEPLRSICLDQLRGSGSPDCTTIIELPQEWGIDTLSPATETQCKKQYDSFNTREGAGWLRISNGQFATDLDAALLEGVLSTVEADILFVRAMPELLAYREKVRITRQGKVAGLRRLYVNGTEPLLSTQRAHCAFCRSEAANDAAREAIKLELAGVSRLPRDRGLRIVSIGVAGTARDIDCESDLAELCGTFVNSLQAGRIPAGYMLVSGGTGNGAMIQGNALIAEDAEICSGAVIVGPSVIGKGVKIGEGAIIKSSVICSEAAAGAYISNRILLSPDHSAHTVSRNRPLVRIRRNYLRMKHGRDQFRNWPALSYGGSLKRIIDIILSLAVIAVFAPVFFLVAIIIKVTSRGPVFFRDKRQGLHGRIFNCLKFRTMLVGADKMQESLRVLNEADGPQFKMTDDPRVSVVGKFLRDTYIDELPQFFNVLRGDMSAVGPRPSPESENAQCPFWRDARLSVRPGITGLWQIYRTRQSMKDFQEWIHYDVKYIKELSLVLDMKIIWQTIKRMVMSFVKQF